MVGGWEILNSFVDDKMEQSVECLVAAGCGVVHLLTCIGVEGSVWMLRRAQAPRFQSGYAPWRLLARPHRVEARRRVQCIFGSLVVYQSRYLVGTSLEPIRCLSYRAQVTVAVPAVPGFLHMTLPAVHYQYVISKTKWRSTPGLDAFWTSFCYVCITWAVS